MESAHIFEKIALDTLKKLRRRINSHSETVENFDETNYIMCDAVIRYVVMAFLCLLLSGERALIEDAPLRYDIIFGEVFEEYPKQKQFIYTCAENCF